MRQKKTASFGLLLGGLIALTVSIILFTTETAEINMNCYKQPASASYCTVEEKTISGTRSEKFLTNNIAHIDIVKRRAGKGHRNHFEIYLKDNTTIPVNTESFNTEDLSSYKDLLESYLTSNNNDTFNMQLSNTRLIGTITGIIGGIGFIVLLAGIILKLLGK